MVVKYGGSLASAASSGNRGQCANVQAASSAQSTKYNIVC